MTRLGASQINAVAMLKNMAFNEMNKLTCE